MDDQNNDLLLYAKNFSNLPKIGPNYFVYRDLPKLIKSYVSGSKTLDYGCGPGHSSTFLKSLDLDVEGMDINEHMVQLAKELDPDGKYCIISSGEIPSKGDHYDLVYVGFVFPYVINKLEMNKILTEIVRVLKPGGTLIIAGPNEHTYKGHWLFVNAKFKENENLVSGCPAKMFFKQGGFTLCQYFWSDADFRDAMSSTGLDLIYAHQPLGNDADGLPWIDETELPLITMYVAKKK